MGHERRKCWLRGLCFGAAFAAGSVSSAAFADTLFFGRDNVGGNAAAPRPNANAAQTNFLAGLTNVRVEDFESFPTVTETPLPVVVTFDATVATLSGAGAVAQTGSGFATSGSNYVRTDFGGDLTLTFSAPQRAFGFFGTDIGDVGGQLILSLVNGTTRTHTVSPSGQADENVLYFGVISDADFTSVSFNNTGSGDIFGFDDFTIADAQQVVPVVPLPPAALAGLGLISLVGAKKLRRRNPRV